MSILKLDKSTTSKIQNAPEFALDPNGEFDIVGESFNEDNFLVIQKIHKVAPGESLDLPAVLLNNPQNVHSPTRTAVGVYIEGLLVGHIPQATSKLFFEKIEKFNGIAKAIARVWMSGDGFNSVRLRITSPIRFSHETPSTEIRKLSGDGSFAFPMRTSKYPIDWSNQLIVKRGLPLLSVGENYIGDDGTIVMGEFGRSPYFFCGYGYIAKPRIDHERDVNSYLYFLGGEARVSYRITRTSEKSHKLHLDWDLRASTKVKKAVLPKAEGDFVQPFVNSTKRTLKWTDDSDVPVIRAGAIAPSRTLSQKNSRPGYTEVNFSKAGRFFLKVVGWAFIGLFFVLWVLFKELLRSKKRR